MHATSGTNYPGRLGLQTAGRPSLSFTQAYPEAQKHNDASLKWFVTFSLQNLMRFTIFRISEPRYMKVHAARTRAGNGFSQVQPNPKCGGKPCRIRIPPSPTTPKPQPNPKLNRHRQADRTARESTRAKQRENVNIVASFNQCYARTEPLARTLLPLQSILAD